MNFENRSTFGKDTDKRVESPVFWTQGFVKQPAHAQHTLIAPAYLLHYIINLRHCSYLSSHPQLCRSCRRNSVSYHRQRELPQHIPQFATELYGKTQTIRHPKMKLISFAILVRHQPPKN